MNQPNQSKSPENIARVFAQYARAIISIAVWTTIALVLTTAGAAVIYLVARFALTAVQIILKALGI